MTLKLVIDNTNSSSQDNNIHNKRVKTCRHDCIFYDQITEQCGVFNNVKIDDPKTVQRCAEFSEWDSTDEQYDDGATYELIENEFSLEIDDQNFLFEIMGDNFSEEKSTYPIQPDYPSNREDAIWFISTDKSYGCWIINHSKSKFISIHPGKSVEKGWSNKIYKSPYPLHNHEAAIPLRSRMAWYIDEQGWGQYVLLINGKIDMITAPRPTNWKL